MAASRDQPPLFNAVKTVRPRAISESTSKPRRPGCHFTCLRWTTQGLFHLSDSLGTLSTRPIIDVSAD